MADFIEILADLIDRKVASLSTDVWMWGSKLKRIKILSVDNRGEIGEEFVKILLEKLGYDVEWISTTDRTEKHWDLTVNGQVKLEVKTATVGKNGRNFQHENIEKDRDYDALVLLDIAPKNLYLTVAPKSTLPFNQPNDNWTVNPKKMHRRAHGIQYKWDLNLTDVKDREIKSLGDVKAIFGNVLPNIE